MGLVISSFLRRPWGSAEDGVRVQEHWMLKTGFRLRAEGYRFSSKLRLAIVVRNESVCWLELLLRVSQELRQDGRQLRGYGSGRAVGPSRAWRLLPRWLHQSLLSKLSALDPSFISHHFSLCTLFSSNVNLLMVPGIALLCHACGFAHIDPPFLDKFL